MDANSLYPFRPGVGFDVRRTRARALSVDGVVVSKDNKKTAISHGVCRRRACSFRRAFQSDE